MSVSDLAPPKIRVAIFHKPVLFDDHFLKGWTFTGGAPTRDGQTVTLNAGQFAEHPCSCSTNIQRYMVFRVVEGSNFVFQIRRASDNVWVHASVGYEPGEWVADLQAAVSGEINAVRFYPVSGTLKVDYLAVTTGFRVPSTGDLTGNLTVNLSLLKEGFSGASISLTNFNEQSDPYDAEVDKGDVVIVWLSRDAVDLGKPEFKVFGGRIVNPTRHYVNYGVVNIVLDCHGHAYELNASPELLRKVYRDAYSKVIVEDAVALCSYVAPHPNSAYWFAGVNKTHSVDYDEVKPLTAVQETAEKASFDVYENPDGALIAHTKMSADFLCPVVTWIRNAVKGDDLHPVRNRIKVYGAAGKRVPSDGDQWTESQPIMWQYNYGFGFNYYYPKVGNSALGLSTVAGKLDAYFTFFFEGETLHNVSSFKWGYGRGSFKNLHFWHEEYAPLGSDFTVLELRAYTDDGNYFYTPISHEGIGWREESIALGSGNEYDPANDEDTLGKWVKVGSPSWVNITKWGIYAEAGAGGCTVYLDGFYFDGAECSGEAEDLASQALYGVRVAEPVSDATLLTDAECILKAESLIRQLVNSDVSIKDFVVDGDHRFRPGDRITMLGVTLRIIQVRHEVSGATWDTVLTVGKN